jgi:hypothetical protein
MPAALEQGIGAGLLLLALYDMFSTVLYARITMGPVSTALSRGTWWLFHRAAAVAPGRQDRIFSYCGPIAIVALILGWTALLDVGSALLVHPVLGTAVIAGTGPTPTDLVTALYVGGQSITVVGTSGYSPTTATFRLLFLLNSVLGMSLIFLALTYLTQVYNALQRRNAVTRRVDALTGKTGDAAELLAGLGAGGQFANGYAGLASVADEIGAITEAHQFYPVLFYFRFRDAAYSVSRMAVSSLDTVSLLKSGVRDEAAGWLKESAAVAQLWGATVELLTTLSRHFLPRDTEATPDRPDAATVARWRRRYTVALGRLRQAGIRTVADEQAGSEDYVALRTRWDRYIRVLSPALSYRPEEVDPATADPESARRRPDFRGRLHRAG